MKNLRKLLGLALCLCALLLFLPGRAEAATGGSCGANGSNLTWTLDGDTLIISGTGAMSDYYEYDDGDYYFESPWEGYSSLRHVIIESGVTSIGKGAFADCKLTDISIPASVTSIGVGAFCGCSSLTGVTIPAGMKIIGTETFKGCTALTAVEIPLGVTSIGSSAFYNSGLTSVIIPAGVKDVYTSAFSNCSGLTSVTLPDSLTNIGQNAFNYCTALTDIYYRGTPEQYGQISLGRACFPDSAVIHYAETVASGSAGTLAWTLMDNGVLTFTGSGAVPDYASAAAAPWAAYASSIRKLYLPEELSAVGENAFGSLTGLTDVYFQNFSAVWDGVTVGAGNEPLNTAAFHPVTVRASGMSGNLSWQLSSSGTLLFTGSGTMGNYSTTSWNSYAPWNPLKYTAYNNTQRIILSEGATSVGSAAFYALDRVSSVSLPSTLRTIGDRAFASCSALTEIMIPEGVTSIGSFAFQYCPMLTSVTIPETVNSIGVDAFAQCSALTDVWFGGTLPEWTALTSGDGIGLPANVTVHTATKRTQGSCGTNLTWSLWSNGTLLIQGAGAMNDYSSSSSAPWRAETYDRVVIAEGVTSVGDYAFYYSSCADFTLPSTLTRIGTSAFANSRISALALPNCNANLENYAFYYCTDLSSISFGSGAVTIGTSSKQSGSVFHHCDALTSVTIPANVSLEYSNMLFEHCDNLETATVRSPILGSYTFECCLKLRSVDLSGVQTVGNGTFLGTPALTAVTYPASVTEIVGMQFGMQGSNYCGISTVTFMNPDVAITGYGFEGSGGNVQTIVAHECSTGHKFAVDNHKTFQALANDNSAHTWVPAWTWAQDRSSASAAFTCSHCGLTAGPAEAAITSETTEATCTAEGVTTYTATVIFGDETFTDQLQETMPALGHTPGEAVLENEIPAFCTADGSYDSVVTCTRCAEELSRETHTIPALGHDIDTADPEWVWAEDLSSAVVRFHCTRCDFYDEVEAVVWDGPTRTEPTHTAEGRIVAYAYADYGANNYDGDMEVTIPALGHDYAEPQWSWNGDHTEAEAVFVCSCGDTQTVEAVVTVSEDPASHNETGLRTCSAQAEFADTVWEDEYTEVLPLIPHAYAEPVWNWTGDHTGAEATFTCECGDVQVVDAEITSQITEPTHTADGLAVYTAQVVFGDLSYTDTATETLPALGHDYGAPYWRWAEDGSSAQYVAVCSCGDELITEATVRTGSTTEPTCTQSGQTKYMATVSYNGSTYRDTKTVVYPALGHDYTETVTEPTCDQQGYTTHTCSRCGDSYVDSYTDALGHDWGEWETMAAPSCTEEGSEQRSCARCGETETRVLEALGHDYAETVTEPTCDQQGYTTHTCTRCGDSYVDSYTDALGHDWGEWGTMAAPSCTEEGSEQRSCSRCSETETRVLEALGHDYTETVTEPTCDQQGYTTHTCNRCGDSCVDSYTDALGHDWGEWETVVFPACTEEGSEQRSCSRCNETETRVLEALGHDYTETVTEPTCDQQGYTTHTCSRCGDSYVDSYTDALGHDWGEWGTMAAPSCTEEGSEQRSCSRCNETETRVLEALGHDYTETVTEPTCDQQGYTTHTCIRCGDSYVDSYTDALGHDWGEWETVVFPACTEEGSEQRSCARCGETETRVLEALGHDYTETVTEPTCDQQGYTTHVCSRCGDSYVDSYTDALGHDWGEWGTMAAPSCTEEGSEQRTCARCGETETRVLEALGHEPGEPVRENETEPTAFEAGGYDEVIFCLRCGEELTRDHITIPALTPEGPVITLQPIDYVGAEGSTASFTVVAEGNGPLTYQWWIRNPGQTEFTKSTRRTATYSTTLKAASNGRELYCVVTDAEGNTAQTDTVTMSIDLSTTAPVITLQPIDYVGAEGSTASFTVVAEGNGPLTYQWWIRNPGQTEFTKSTRRTATYSTTLKAASSGRELYCVVTDAEGNTAQTDTVTMSIDLSTAAPVITLQPIDYVGAEGSTASFTVVAEGNGPLTYQWWIRNPGQTEFTKSTRRTATYSTTLKAASSGRELYCVVTDAEGNSVRTDIVTMTISMPLTITQQPVDYLGTLGSTATFTVVAEGNGPLTYQWWIRNPGETEFTKSTRRTATYSTTLKAASNGRELYCIVTDAEGNTAQTDVVTMTVESVILTITQQPVDYLGTLGSTATFTVVAEGNGPLTYQWWIRNPGETEFTKSTRRTATYSTTLKAASSGRELYCVVTDAEGNTAQTDVVTMTVESVILTITQQPVDYVGAEGSTASFTVVAEGNGPLTYQWWIRNPGETEFTKSTRRTATYSTTLKAASSGRELYCVVTDTEGNTAQTDVVTMTVG